MLREPAHRFVGRDRAEQAVGRRLRHDAEASTAVRRRNVEAGVATAFLTILGNLSLVLGRKLRWDPAQERFVNNGTANRRLVRAMRSPWRL